MMCLLAGTLSYAQTARDRFENPSEIVFIPGILGSKLTNNGEMIWGGEVFRKENLEYTGERATAEPFDSAKVAGFNVRSVAYGEYFEQQLRDLSVGEPFVPFSYDWRASNVESADKFQDFICGRYSQRPIERIIVAHSMGGLVLKHWMMNHYEDGCDGDKLRIRAIVFVATPHFGAPKAFFSLITRASLTDYPLVDRRVSAAVNEYGVTFDSIYELLPFSHTYRWKNGKREICFDVPQGVSSVEDPLRFRILSDEDGSDQPVDIFSSDVLFRMGIRNRLNAIGIANPRSYLQEKLDRAREVSCRLSDFEFPRDLQGSIHFLAGRLLSGESNVNTTLTSVIFSERRNLLEKYEEGVEGVTQFGDLSWNVFSRTGKGDKTVPLDIASNGDLVSADVTRVDASHMEILNKIAFRELLQNLKVAVNSQTTEFERKTIWINPNFTPTEQIAADVIRFAGMDWGVLPPDTMLQQDPNAVGVLNIEDIVKGKLLSLSGLN